MKYDNFPGIIVERRSLLELLDDAVKQSGHKVKRMIYIVNGESVGVKISLEKLKEVV